MSDRPTRLSLKLIAVVQQRAELEPNNAEAHYTVAIYYWDEACRNGSLTGVQRREYIMNGLAAVDKAIALNPDYVDALVYRGLLLRIEAQRWNRMPTRQKALLTRPLSCRRRRIGYSNGPAEAGHD